MPCLSFAPLSPLGKTLLAPPDETELIRRVTEGDRTAFGTLYAGYYDRLFRFLLRTTRRRDAVEELIQETLLVVWEKPGGFDHSCKLSTWIFGIAYRKALKFLARSAPGDAALDLEEFKDHLADETPCPAQQVESSDWLRAALESLSPPQRAIVELTFQQGLNYREIAEILGCPESTVKTRMFHARKKLQHFAATVPGES
jgi:RNA polymerase sigma-70 factor (ECF subfamily)